MEIPGLGPVTVDTQFGNLVSAPLPVPVLGGRLCRFEVVGYDHDEAKEEFGTAVRAFLGLDASALTAASLPVFEYYTDVRNEVGDEGFPSIAGPDDIWSHVSPGAEVTVERDLGGNGQVYVSVECECAWEPEHGLQLVFRGGRSVSKVGPFDGHLTNGPTFGGDDLADVVYHRFG